jgi:hypothetical protein
VAGSCEHGNETYGFIGAESLEQLSGYLLVKDCAPWSLLMNGEEGGDGMKQ